eukprot:scaffold225109_cov32-Tisochrysis_lutea.AAC.2
MSPPAEKAEPAPVSTTAPSCSADSSATARCNASPIALVIALSDAGRLSRSTPTRPRRSSRTGGSSGITHIPRTPASARALNAHSRPRESRRDEYESISLYSSDPSPSAARPSTVDHRTYLLLHPRWEKRINCI